MSVSEPLNVSDWERLARERVDPSVWCYFEGGSGDELTLQDNVAAFGRVRFRPRVLVDVEDVSTEVELLGSTLSMPVVVAPIAYQDLLDPSGDLATARAAASTGTAVCVSTFAGHTHAEIAAAAPGVVQWAQLYVLRDEGMTRAHLEEAVDAGCSAVVLTVDTPRLGIRERDLRAGFEVPPELPMPYVRGAVGDASANPLEQFGALSSSVTWRDIERIAGETGLPVLVKGIVTREDAELAMMHGVDGVFVSNHGGRADNTLRATIDCVSEVVAGVKGRAPVIVDSGFRRGGDIFKALALGATAVGVGRPYIWGLASFGQEGVETVLDILRRELLLTMRQSGVTSIKGITRNHIVART